MLAGDGQCAGPPGTIDRDRAKCAMTLRRTPRPSRLDRRAFLSYAAASVASMALAACSQADTPTVKPSPVVGTATLAGAGTPTPAANARDTTGPPASQASATPPGRGLATSPPQRSTFISPLDPAWSYTSGPWAALPHPGLSTSRMVPIMSDAWVRGGNVVKGGVGRRCAITTDSPFATLLSEADGRSLTAIVEGTPIARIGPLPTDGSRREIPLFQGRGNTTRIELVFDALGANDGLYVAAGAAVFPVPYQRRAMPRLVVFGHGYAAGAGASALGMTGCAALIGDQLKMEAISQGWERTDVDVRSGEQGDPRNSGLDRVAADVISLTPAVILLIYGLHAAQGQRASWEYAYRYAELLRAIRTALPGVPLFCSGFPPCNENLSAAFVQEWNAAVRSAANTVDNCPFIEAAGWWGTTNFYGGSGPVYVDSDRIHPNDAGHRFLADKYAAVIKQYMG
jgi:lysophospholipase L1-like esterase